MSDIKISEKEMRFLKYYTQTANATEAAKKVGYKGRSACDWGSNTLKKESVKKFLDSMTKDDDIASIFEILSFLTRVVRGEEKDAFGLDASIQDRLKASDMLLKRYKAIDDKEIEALAIEAKKLEIELKKVELERVKNGESLEESKIFIINDIESSAEECK